MFDKAMYFLIEKQRCSPRMKDIPEGACLGLSDDKVILVTGGGGIGRSTVYELRWLMDKAGSAIANAVFDARAAKRGTVYAPAHTRGNAEKSLIVAYGRATFSFEVACPLNSARAFLPNPRRLGAGPSIPYTSLRFPRR
jgi:hypothetical protein